ncbi:unnamed protein product [Candidula unifasciata]|uniref:Death domain-containing protein n=1 Tax=Candidula unifasciata TaxID=100452 RepID=A0A8S3YUF6_9EUPU|nr:unnamed protein product [Candidula unifasciata]
MIMPKTRGKLKPGDENSLRANYSYLAGEIDAQYLVAELFSQFVIDANDKEKIQSKATARERTLVLLDVLLDSGPGEAYNKFVEVLTKEYPDAAEKLKEEAPFEETLQPQYSWYEELPAEIKNCVITEADASRISNAIGGGWRHVMALLGIRDVEIQQELFNHPHAGPADFITTFLIKWRQRQFRQATVDKLVSVLKEVDEAGTCTVDWGKVEKALKKNLPQV